MRKFSFLIFIFLGLCIQSKTQSVSFEKIEYASFDINSYRTNVKDSIFVHLYSSITSDGIIKIYNPRDLRQDSPRVYYSFVLTPSELSKINSIFNFNKPLKTYLVKTKLEANEMYAGSYDFYRVSYPNGMVDSICLIVPFVSGSFNKVNGLFIDIFYRRRNRTKIDTFTMPSDFFASLKECYLRSKYLPEIKEVPPFIPQKNN